MYWVTLHSFSVIHVKLQVYELYIEHFIVDSISQSVNQSIGHLSNENVVTVAWVEKTRD